MSIQYVIGREYLVVCECCPGPVAAVYRGTNKHGQHLFEGVDYPNSDYLTDELGVCQWVKVSPLD